MKQNTNQNKKRIFSFIQDILKLKIKNSNNRIKVIPANDSKQIKQLNKQYEIMYQKSAFNFVIKK